MFVGEAPGAREDESGRPFVGRSGELLTSLIAGIGFAREDVFITSILKSRPPKNRTPRKGEVHACMPYLERQFEIISPEVIVLLGSVAVSSLIGPWKMGEAHGRFYEGNKWKFFITYHPAAALRFPKTKDIMKADFEILRLELE
jgi:DNA polymerase